VRRNASQPAFFLGDIPGNSGMANHPTRAMTYSARVIRNVHTPAPAVADRSAMHTAAPLVRCTILATTIHRAPG